MKAFIKVMEIFVEIESQIATGEPILAFPLHIHTTGCSKYWLMFRYYFSDLYEQLGSEARTSGIGTLHLFDI